VIDSGKAWGLGTQLSRCTAVQQQCIAIYIIIPVGYSKRDLILQADYLSIDQKRFNLTLISIPFEFLLLFNGLFLLKMYVGTYEMSN